MKASEIEILYHGDIDDAPIDTVVAEGTGIRWALREIPNKGSSWCSEYPDNPGNNYEICQEEYQLLKALCMTRTDPTANLRKAVEEMMNSYRLEAKERKNDAYWRGAADACGNILDMPEMKLFLKEQQ